MTVWWRRAITLVFIVVLMFPITGCWDYESISTRASIIGIGVDPVKDDPDKIEITIQYPILFGTAGPGETGGGSTGPSSSAMSNYRTLSIQSYSLAGAMRHLQLKVDHELDTAQLRAIVMSQELSSNQMDSVVGQIIRFPRINHLAYVFSTPGFAKDILFAQGTDSAPMDFLDKSMTFRQHGFFPRRRLWEYWRDATQVGAIPILPVVRAVPADDTDARTLALGGSMVYMNNHAAFRLSRQESFYATLLSDRARNIAFDARVPEGIVSLTEVRSNNRRGCVVKDGQIMLVDHVFVHATLAKLVDPTPKPMPPTNVSKLESETEEYLKQQLTETLEKLQERQADICGFGRMYLQRHPEDVEKMKKAWGAMFQHAKPDIDVTVTIVSKGMLI